MAEFMNEWQKLAAVFKRIAENPQQWDSKTIEISISPKLGNMVKNNEKALAAVTNAGEKRAELSLIEKNDKKYVLIFPDVETAEKSGEKCIEVSAAELFRTASVNPEISGLQLVYEADEKTRSFFAGEISRKALYAALELGIKASKVSD